MTDVTTQSRAAFLRGGFIGRHSEWLRPPWSDETTVKSSCTSCGACLQACPQSILAPGPAGTPVVDFQIDACTFCGRCADACQDSVFRSTDEEPWPLKATIASTCLLQGGVTCRSCTDGCDPEALKFLWGHGTIGTVEVDSEQCTGCGGCIAICPVNAISMTNSSASA